MCMQLFVYPYENVLSILHSKGFFPTKEINSGLLGDVEKKGADFTFSKEVLWYI